MRTMLHAKIHRATVTQADLNYEGSITLDPLLIEAADLMPFEQIHVLDVDNGNRLVTYVIEGERGSGCEQYLHSPYIPGAPKMGCFACVVGTGGLKWRKVEASPGPANASWRARAHPR